MSTQETFTEQVVAQPLGPKNRTAALFLISVLALFLELLLIRWIATEINIFAYLQNTVLVVCFMGLGMGCLTCRQPVVIRKLLIPLFFLALLLAIPFTRVGLGKISLLLSSLGDLVVWDMVILNSPFKTILAVSVGLAVTFFLAVFIWAIFVPIGRILGQLMEEHPRPIWAYSINIAGSLVGIWIFVLLSVFYQPPVTWVLLAAILLLFFINIPAPQSVINLLLLLGTLIFSWFASRDLNSIAVLWSPYQKLALSKTDLTNFPYYKYRITVNNTFYQGIVDLSEEKSLSHPQLDSSAIRGLSQYDIPFLLHPNPRTALIVGAGTGNDVAGALRHGIKEITAVEIDPAIIDLGRQYHPERPYDSPKVRNVNDDARSFFASSKEKYDLISFGFLDAHTTVSMTDARLDNYVYTKESLQKAKSFLTTGGIMSLVFWAQRPYIADRIARVLRDIFGQDPIVFRIPAIIYGPGAVMFIAGDLKTARQQMADHPRLSSLIAKWGEKYPLHLTYKTAVTTDDWPYLYLRSREIPLIYFLVAAMMFALFLYTQWRFKLGKIIGAWKISHWHFFFLGAAFLLLEVQNISKAAVVLGNTWLVNAVIISGILVMILLANLIAANFPRISIRWVYAGLIGSCIGLYFVDLARFAFLPYYEKAAIIGSLTALPVLFSGIIFIRSFASVIRKDMALGANLVGSLVGGMLQSVTFITGIKALLLIVAVLYGAALLCSPTREP